MDLNVVTNAAAQFIGPGEKLTVKQVGNGLIHHTYHAKNTETGFSILLQAINTAVFIHPEDIIQNYLCIFRFLSAQKNQIQIPEPVPCQNGEYLFRDQEENSWRATQFIEHSYSPDIASDEDSAFLVAKSFGSFTRSLDSFDIRLLKPIIPGFHNLAWRYEQFREAIKNAPLDRLLKSTHVIAELREREPLAAFYQTVTSSPHYPLRVMHHDCKISNILFDEQTDKVICPVDLDTVMPGNYFSDLGDMIRTMACTVDENSTAWEEIDIRPSYYKSILGGYMEAMADILTPEEKENIHFAGKCLIYMQSLRFAADFLNGDTYYKTTYPEQNLNRAFNQLLLLEKLETLTA